ncbi:hypothetical protein V6N11_039134 [Hibiscus sabdariffa]|uniref:Uncharacterized protein n=1 Tax=Hibiscus sabdariffa TaxID=183260 RepID=A0ABR2SM27_9ROSI
MDLGIGSFFNICLFPFPLPYFICLFPFPFPLPQNANGEAGNFECNICFVLAQDPILIFSFGLALTNGFIFIPVLANVVFGVNILNLGRRPKIAPPSDQNQFPQNGFGFMGGLGISHYLLLLVDFFHHCLTSRSMEFQMRPCLVQLLGFNIRIMVAILMDTTTITIFPHKVSMMII